MQLLTMPATQSHLKQTNHENDMQLLTMPTAQSQREQLNYDIM